MPGLERLRVVSSPTPLLAPMINTRAILMLPKGRQASLRRTSTDTDVHRPGANKGPRFGTFIRYRAVTSPGCDELRASQVIETATPGVSADVNLLEFHTNADGRLLSASPLGALVSLASVNANAADIVDTAVKAGQFNTLAAALKAGDLHRRPEGDWAFHGLCADRRSLQEASPRNGRKPAPKPENKAQLVKILTYHVVPGKVMSSALAGNKTEAKTVQGGVVTIDATKGGVTVNDAKVVTADVAADNGVIHVIDTVLIPK